MELQQLRYVLAVAEEKNFTRAAQKCHVVQSALSHQIKSLEQEIGTELFARTSRRVELTEAGRAFIPEAQAALTAASRAISEAQAASGQIRGRLSIGLIPSVTAVDVPAVLGKLHVAHPGVQISLSTGGSDTFISEIRAGRMDIAVLGLPEQQVPEHVATRVLARERLVAVLSKKHRLAKRKELRLEDLASEEFVDFSLGSPGRIQSDLAFVAAGVSRTVSFEAMNVELILDLVDQALAVAMLPEALITPVRDLVCVPVADGPSRIEYLAWSDFNPSPATLEFIRVLETDLE